MKVTQTGPRDQRKSFAKYKQTLGRADPIIVRRALTFAHAVTHPSSRATAQQRDRFARASQYEASINFEDKNLVPLANRLSFVSKPGTAGTAKVLTGRQAIVSQAIRDQQTGNPIVNYFYPCLNTRDAVGNTILLDAITMINADNPAQQWIGRKLNETQFLFPGLPPDVQNVNINHIPTKGFGIERSWPQLTRADLKDMSTRLRPSIHIYNKLTGNGWTALSDDPLATYTRLSSPHGMIVHIPVAHTPPYNHDGQIPCSINWKVEYEEPTAWRFTWLASTFPTPPQPNWYLHARVWTKNRMTTHTFWKAIGYEGYSFRQSVDKAEGE